MDNYSSERKEQAIETRWMFAKWTGAFEELIVDEFGIWEIRTLGFGRGNAARVGRPGFAHFRRPGIVALSVMLAISSRMACSCWWWMRKVAIEHGDEVIRDSLAEPAVEGKRLEH